jgi:uncharacterized damage-inducible protein DinB
MTKKERLLAHLERMEVDRRLLMKRLDGIPPEKLAERPGPGKWSVSQVMMHLVVAEEGALAYLKKKIEYGGHLRAGLFAELRLSLLELAIKLPFRYKAPAIVADIPECTFEGANERWAAVRGEMRRTYTELDEAVIDHELFKHPMVGRFGLLQGIQFMHTHMTRHLGQVERTVIAVTSTD